MRPTRVRAPASLLVAALLAGCTIVPYESSIGGGLTPRMPAVPFAEDRPHPKDAGDLVLLWSPSGHEATREALVADPGIDEWVALMNAELALPRDIEVVHTECGVENAYYSPDDERVTLCYELLNMVAAVMDNAGLDPDVRDEAIGSAWLFVLFHEVGHALVDMYDLPITGREEDAVDDLAAIVLIDAGAADAVVAAAVFWILTDDGQYSDAKFADEHSLNPQRFYTLLCTVYGSDPQAHADLVEYGYLPYERAQRCPREYGQKDASWTALLAPWRKSAEPTTTG